MQNIWKMMTFTLWSFKQPPDIFHASKIQTKGINFLNGNWVGHLHGRWCGRWVCTLFLGIKKKKFNWESTVSLTTDQVGHVSVMLVAATVMALGTRAGEKRLAGKPEFPAATATWTPLAVRDSTALSRVKLTSPPSDMLTTEGVRVSYPI